jgi:hypothetical protein
LASGKAREEADPNRICDREQRRQDKLTYSGQKFFGVGVGSLVTDPADIVPRSRLAHAKILFAGVTYPPSGE